MMKNPTKIMALTVLILSNLLVLSSENWLSMWMGMEINMIAFIPLLKENKNFSSPESKMMYFLMQSLGSMIFMFSIIMTPMMMINEMNTNKEIMIVITASMMMKMGAAPMHMWFIIMMSKISWNSCLLLMTWQKISPMWVMSNLYYNHEIISLCAIMSAVTGAIGGINQTSIKKIMAFSSVNHLSWLIICLKYSNEMWMKYFIIYSIMVFFLTNMFNQNSIFFMNQMNMNMKTNMSKINLLIMMLSMGGLPPFMGFLPKWIVISTMINEGSMMVILILMFSSMITLFYYMRMITPIIMTWSTMNKWNIKNYESKFFMAFMLMFNMLLPTTMMLNLI